MGDCGAAVEHQVTGLQRFPCGQAGTGAELLIGGSGQCDAGGAVGGFRQAGAVETCCAIATPHIGAADL